MTTPTSGAGEAGLPGLPVAKREAAIAKMREALESAYCVLFNGSRSTKDELERALEEVTDATCDADEVGIKCGNQKALDDLKLLVIAGTIQHGIEHEMGPQTIARAVLAVLEKKP